MSEVIDTSVVKLKFDSNEFVNNVNMSIMAVDALKDSLVFDSKSFDSLNKAANNIDLSAISANVESLSQRFSTFGIVGMTAIERITNAAIDLGAKLGGLLAAPWKQIVSGGWKRASNIGQAKFQLEGLFGKTEEGVAKLNMTMLATSEQVAQLAEQAQGFSADMIVAMNAADYAVADTAYGLDSAAKAASVLATSGVDVVHFSEDLKDASGLMRTEMQVALRGISGVAAMANRDYDDVARVFERVSGAGRVMGDDLNSLASYGLNAAATLRDYLNELDGSVVRTEQDIRDMVSKGEIDFMTFAKAMDSAYGDHAKDANNTFSGALGNMKFALSKIGADFISPIRNKMVPLFNDLRIAINQVRKALNFKMKFPGLEEEVSLVELFTRVVTNLSEKIHGLLVMWHGGQNVMEQAMAGFANRTGVAFEQVKNVFDSVEKGSQTASGAINQLVALASSRGQDLTEVYANLGETFNKTESEIREMCRNGEISFEDFYAAMSNVFGSDIADSKISGFANIISNMAQGLVNVAKIIAGIVGPVFYAFFQVFNLGGMNGIVGITGAFANFTKTLILSRPVQEKVRKLAVSIFSIIKGGLKVVMKLASAAFKVAQAIAPLFVYILDFADVIASVISYLVDIVVESKILNSVITILGRAFQVAGYIIVNVLRIIMSLIGPAIRGIGEVFAFLARSIGSIDFSFLGVILDQLENFVDAIVNGGIMTALQTTVANFFNTVGNLFSGMTMSFELVCKTLETAAARIAAICQRIIDSVRNLKEPITDAFSTLFTKLLEIIKEPRKLIAVIGQLTSLTLLARFAQTMRGIGRTFSGLGNYLNSNAILAFVNSIKILARAILEFSVAIVLLSSIPTENLYTTLRLLGALSLAVEVFLITYFAYMAIITKINTNVQADPMVKFMNKLNASINKFLGSLGRSATIISLAVAFLMLAASFGFLFNAIKQFSDTTQLSKADYETGLKRVIQILVLMVSAVSIMGMATRAIMAPIGSTIIDSSIRGGSGGLMGAAVAMLSLLIVLEAFEDIIKQYATMRFLFNDKTWKETLLRIAASVAIIAFAVGIIGATSKGAALGLMSSATAMMGLMTALEAFEGIIRLYYELMYGDNAYDSEKLNDVLGLLAGIFIVLMTGLGVLAYVLSRGTSSFSAFKGGIKSGIEFTSNAARFLGVIVLLMGICVAFQAFALAVNTIDPDNLASAGVIIGMLFVIFAGMATLVGLSKSVPVGNTIGLTVMMVALSGILPLLSAYNWVDLIKGAASLAVIIGMLSYMIKALGSFENVLGGITGIVFMGIALYGILPAIEVLSYMDTARALDGAIGIAAILFAFSKIFKVIGKVTDLKAVSKAWVAMSSMLAVLVPVITLLGWISNMEMNATNLFVLVSALSMLGLAISVMMTIMNLGTVKVAKGILIELVGIAVMLSVLAFALVGAANAFTGKTRNLSEIAKSLNYLIPVIVVVGMLSAVMSSLGTTWKGVGLIGAIVGIISSLVFIFTMIAKIGDVGDTTALMKGFCDSVVGLTVFIGTLVALGSVIGLIAMTGVGIPVLLGGLLGIISILSTIAGFVAMIAGIGMIGEASNTVTILQNLGSSLDAMIPFLLKMGAMCAVAGIVSPLILAGATGFGAILTVVSGFAFMMAIVANIGNLSSTISIIGTITNALNELVGTFKVLVVLGLLAAPIVTGMTLLITAVGLLLSVSLIIGQFDVIREAILSGINTILVTATSLVVATETMNLIDISAIGHFILALSVLAFSPLAGIVKFSLIATMMSAIGVSSSTILKGTMVAREMIRSLSDTADIIKSIVKISSGKLVTISADLLKTAYNLSQMSGMYHVLGMIDGLLDPNMLSKLAAAAAIAAWVVAASMRNTLGIHSPGEEGAAEMDYHILGQISSLTDQSNISSLIGAGSDLMGTFGSNMMNMASAYGSDTGTMYVESLSQSLFAGLKYVGQGWSDLISYAGADGWFGAAGIKWSENHEVLALSNATDANNEYANSVLNVSNAEKEYINENGTRPYFSPNLVREKTFEDELSEAFEMPDYTTFIDDLLKPIEDSFSLGSIGDSIGDIAGSVGDLDSASSSASSSVNKLKDSIEDLMEEYENLWEDAKERANKDLFKGVDDQGDDFLDKVQDIMDEYAKIYESAVERTNEQDLFAEVNENDESFAPDTLLRNLEDQVNQVNELNTIIGSLSGRIADNGLRAAIANMSVDDLPELRAMYRMDNSQLSKYEDMYRKKVQANQNKIQNELTGSLSQLTGEYTNVATYVATDASTNKLLHNLQAQVDQLNEYNATVSSLMGRIKDVNLREAIANMGVDSIEELKNLNRMTDAQLDEYVALYNQKINSEALSIKNELSGQLGALLGEAVDIDEFYAQYKAGLIDFSDRVTSSDDTKKAGRKIGSEMASGASESLANMKLDKDEAYANGKAYIESMAEGLKDPDAMDLLIANLNDMANLMVENMCDHHAEDFVYIGKMIVEGILRGLEEAQDTSFDESVDTISQRIVDKIDAFNDKFIGIGKNIVRGIIIGMTSQEMMTRLTNTAAQIAKKVVKTVKDNLDLHSPSRVFIEIGKYVDEGFAIGLRDYASLATDEASAMAEGSMSAVQEAIQQLSGMLDGSIDVNPVITPTLDLSDVNARSAALASMFNGRQIAVQMEADAQQEAMMSRLGDIIAENNSEPRSVVFNQTNNSPKALSRTEIYRQTKNGFSQLANALS